MAEREDCLVRCRGSAWDELGAGGGERERREDNADPGSHLNGGLAAGFWQGPPHLLAGVRLRSAVLLLGCTLSPQTVCCMSGLSTS